MNDSDMYRAGIPLNVKGTPYVRTLPLPVKALRACERCVWGRGKHSRDCSTRELSVGDALRGIEIKKPTRYLVQEEDGNAA